MNEVLKDLSGYRVAMCGVRWRLFTNPIGQGGMDQVSIRIWYHVYCGIAVVASFSLYNSGSREIMRTLCDGMVRTLSIPSGRSTGEDADIGARS